MSNMKFKIGDRVRVVGRHPSHNFKLGTKVTIGGCCLGKRQLENYYECVGEQGEWWYCNESDLAPIEEPAATIQAIREATNRHTQSPEAAREFLQESGIEPKVHELKTWPEYFQAIKAGIKSFEIRNNDRGFKVGDVLNLKEWKPTGYSGVSPNEMTGHYTGEEIRVVVTYIFSGDNTGNSFGLMGNVCVMAIKPAAMQEYADLQTASLQAEVADLQDVIKDKERLCREIDVIMFGEDGAAKQPALCDIAYSVQDLVKEKAELLEALGKVDEVLDDDDKDRKKVKKMLTALLKRY